MRVLRRAPFVVHSRFLREGMRDAIYQDPWGTQAEFEPARTNDGLQRDVRRSLFRADCLRGLENRAGAHFEAELSRALTSAFVPLRLAPFEPTFTELHGLIYRDGDFFRAHNDTGPNNTRRVTFVYTLHEEPHTFTGADLLLYDTYFGSEGGGDEQPYFAHTHARIPSEDNRLVLFPSEYYHEVTRLDGKSARLVVNGWFHTTEEEGALERIFAWPQA